MVKKAASSVVVIMLILACFAFVNSVKAQVATPSKAEITVTGIPSGTKSLAVEVTVDSSVVKLGSVSADSGGLGLADSGSKGVGTFSDMDLPATVKITVDLTGVVAGMSNFAVGKVLDMLGTDGVEITGAMATANISSISVASSSTTTSSSSTSSSTGGTGMLSQETFTVMINGQSLNTTNGVNVTLAFGTDGVVTVDTSSLDFMGTGATKLLTEVMGNVLTAAWDGLITDAALTLSGKFKAGSMSGTTTVSVGKVEVAGGTNVTALAIAKTNPNYIFAATFGTIFITSNVGTSWNNISAGLPSNPNITRIAVSSNTETTLWVSCSNYNAGNKVYKSMDAGTTWTNVSTGLPNIPANCVTYDENSAIGFDAIYVGTDLGVYYRDSSLTTWTPFNGGLPNVIIDELEINYTNDRIYAGTYGRGLWSSPTNTTVVSGTTTAIPNKTATKSTISIYPNPNNGIFNVDINSTLGETNVNAKVYNLIGELVYTIPEESIVAKQYQIDLSKYSNGIYLVKITTGFGTRTERVVVNR